MHHVHIQHDKSALLISVAAYRISLDSRTIFLNKSCNFAYCILISLCHLEIKYVGPFSVDENRCGTSVCSQVSLHSNEMFRTTIETVVCRVVPSFAFTLFFYLFLFPFLLCFFFVYANGGVSPNGEYSYSINI